MKNNPTVLKKIWCLLDFYFWFTNIII